MSAIRLRVQVSGSQAAIGRPPAACVVNDCPSNDATDRRTMPADEPSGAELGRRDHDVGQHPVTLEGQVDLPTDEIAHEGSLEIADTGDRATIERDDDVAGPDASGRGGRAVEELDDLEAGRSTDPCRQRNREP